MFCLSISFHRDIFKTRPDKTAAWHRGSTPPGRHDILIKHFETCVRAQIMNQQQPQSNRNCVFISGWCPRTKSVEIVPRVERWRCNQSNTLRAHFRLPKAAAAQTSKSNLRTYLLLTKFPLSMLILCGQTGFVV